MALGRQKPGDADPDKWLEVDASMTGTLAFKDPVNLQINGRFDGTLNTRGNLSIGEKAQVKAEIYGESISIGGTVTGTITASSRVELLAKARLTGKVISPRVVMHEGAVLHGTLDMLGAEGSTWMGVDDLARFLEVDAATVTDWAQSGRLPGRRQGNTWQFERARIDEWIAQEKIKSA